MLFSIVLIYLLLLIPVNFKTVWLNQGSQLSVTLLKEQIKIIEVQKPLIDKTKPIEKPVEEVKKPVKNPAQVIQQITKQAPTNNIIAVKPKLPSAGTILNSVKQSKPFSTVSLDFKQMSEIDLDFKPKKWVKPKEKKLIVVKHQLQPMVNIKTPLALKTLRTAIGFLITPMKGAEKTQDHLNYCPTLGRRSVFCPNANPLVD